MTINASVANGNLFVVNNSGTDEFSISATGHVDVGGTLVVAQDIASLGEVLGSTAVVAQNAATSSLQQGEVVMLDGVASTTLGTNPIITVLPAAATTSTLSEPVVVGIVDRNLAEFGIPGAPAAAGSDVTVVAPSEYADVVTAGTFAEVDVDASAAPIAVGDRLTLSANAGYARKLVLPGDAGAPVVGIALDALASGTGQVRVLITLGAGGGGVTGAAPSAINDNGGLDRSVYGAGFDWGTSTAPSVTPTPAVTQTPDATSTPVVTPTPAPTDTPTITATSTPDGGSGAGDASTTLTVTPAGD